MGRRRGTVGSLALAALLAASLGVSGTGAAGAVPPEPSAATLPADLGPPVRVGLDVGQGAARAVTVTAVQDPDVPSAAPPMLTVTLDAQAAAADAGASAALDGGAGAGEGGTVFAVAAPSMSLVALGPDDLAVLGTGLGAAAAETAALAPPGAVAVALGTSGRGYSVLLPVAPSAPAPAGSRARLVASGARAGPYPSLAAAQGAAAVLAGAGLWAFPELEGATGGTAWYARVLGSARASSRTAAARAAVRATAAALSAAPVVPVLGGGAGVLVAAAGHAVLAPAVWALGAPGALALAGGPAGGAYAGAIVVARAAPDKGLKVVNDVPLERYVAGVVPCEMPASWPAAALEAQAVASRTYAVWALDSRGAAAPYILSSGPGDQVYKGLDAETPSTDWATWATAGEILTYGGAPIDAIYEPDSGGYTASSADVWGSALPYLVARPEPPGYVSPHRWRVTRTASELRQAARALGTPTGPVQMLEVLAREVASGRVIDLVIVGATGRAALRDDGVRTGLGLPSNLFRVRTPTEMAVEGAGGTRTLLGLDRAAALAATGEAALAPGRTAVVEGAAGSRGVPTTPPSYVFVGRGEGPGLGMSQDGARFLAERGDTAAAILLYYYQGATLTRNDGEGAP